MGALTPGALDLCPMGSVFAQSLARNHEQALQLMEAALDDCPAELWEVDLWPDAPARPAPTGGLHGSAPWFLGYHALTCLDYDLSGGFEPWEPPPPFDENTYAFPNRVFTRPELLGYVQYCRGRVSQTLDSLTEARSATQLPGDHRHHGQVFGEYIAGLPLHMVEHAAQIRQFLTSSGVQVRPLPGDWGFAG